MKNKKQSHSSPKFRLLTNPMHQERSSGQRFNGHNNIKQKTNNNSMLYLQIFPFQYFYFQIFSRFKFKSSKLDIAIMMKVKRLCFDKQTSHYNNPIHIGSFQSLIHDIVEWVLVEGISNPTSYPSFVCLYKSAFVPNKILFSCKIVSFCK